MSDLMIRWSDELLSFDLALDGADPAVDDGLETAVVLSLFTDARALDGDPLPDPAMGRRGWWGDAYPPADAAGAPATGDRHGSRLWTLWREKQTEETRRRAETYAAEALAWMVADGIAARVDVAASWAGPGILALAVTITRPGSAPLSYRWAAAWAALAQEAA